jgi:hypothetical protein
MGQTITIGRPNANRLLPGVYFVCHASSISCKSDLPLFPLPCPIAHISLECATELSKGYLCVPRAAAASLPVDFDRDRDVVPYYGGSGLARMMGH